MRGSMSPVGSKWETETTPTTPKGTLRVGTTCRRLLQEPRALPLIKQSILCKE